MRNLLLPNELMFDWEKTQKIIIAFIKKQFNDNNLNNVIIGLSGGVDSSVTATLAVEALGKQNVIGVLLHEKDVTPNQDALDSKNLIIAYLFLSEILI